MKKKYFTKEDLLLARRTRRKELSYENVVLKERYIERIPIGGCRILTEVIKHPTKVKPFSRKNIMDIAKVLRNTAISTASREIVTRALANYFEREDQFFDRKTFNQIASGVLDFDKRTAAWSTVQEKPNDPEV